MADTPISSELVSAELVNDCVHCGFCLPSCPTYVLWQSEPDSPRGRIDLMRVRVEGGSPVTDTMALHIDRCLGCLACVTACPSGVRYDRLIEQTRATVEREHRRGLGARLLRAGVFALFPYPRRLRAMRPALIAYQKMRLDRLLRRAGVRRLLPRTLAALTEITPPVRRRARLAEVIGARGERRARVGLLTGCVQDAFFSDVNAATARVLAAEGCEVIVPRGQSCCGALSTHNGRTREARRFARRLVATFEAAAVDAIVVNAAGCGSAMKEYGETLRDDPQWSDRAARLAARTKDLSEFLAELGPREVRSPVPLRVAYHDACHLAHGQRVREQPRRLLRQIPGLELVDLAEPELCCGSAGIYNLLQPGAAQELGDRKASHIAAARPDVVVSGNPGCLMQLTAALRRAGADVPTMAIATLLDQATGGTSAD
jgi:glycolate oxidase iron-sulfur subunit